MGVTDNSLHRFAFRDPIVAELLASGIDYYARMTGKPEVNWKTTDRRSIINRAGLDFGSDHPCWALGAVYSVDLAVRVTGMYI